MKWIYEYKQSYLETSENGKCEITESNLETLKLVFDVHDFKVTVHRDEFL